MCEHFCRASLSWDVGNRGVRARVFEHTVLPFLWAFKMHFFHQNLCTFFLVHQYFLKGYSYKKFLSIYTPRKSFNMCHLVLLSILLFTSSHLRRRRLNRPPYS